MSPFKKLWCFAVLMCAALLPGLAVAQRPHSTSSAAKTAPGTYDISNDVSLQGTVLKYTENSPTPPIGAHVLLQTASGNVDVHLGDARLLRLAKLNIAQGANVRFVGQMHTAGSNTVFLARLVQIGTQVLAVRSDHGLPLAPAGPRSSKALLANVPADQQGGAR